MECVAYMRVSTERQAEEGNGLDSQKRDIEIYARKNELIINDWYIDDGYTGANMERPQLQRLINDCMSKKVKCVIAFKLDRLSRSMVDGIYIIERVFQPNNVKFACVHDSVSYDSPMEQAYTQMMAVFAQLDKNTMMLRMRGGMLERVKQGYWMGGGNLPYCYTYNRDRGILEVIPERKEQANAALDLFLQGYSDVKIHKMLGYKTERVVHQILTSVVNIGKIPYKGEVYQGQHEPIFDEDKYNRGLELRKVRCNSKYVEHAHLLTGLCRCGVCGCAMRYQKWGNKHAIYCYSRNKDMDYIPNHNSKCTNKTAFSTEIESQVEKKILDISLNLKKKETVKQVSKIEILEQQLTREQNKLKRLYELYSDGNDTVIEMIKDKESEINDIKIKIKEECDNKAKEPKKDVVYDNIKKLADVWDNISIEAKNKILKNIIKKIVITNGDIDIILNNF